MYCVNNERAATIVSVSQNRLNGTTRALGEANDIAMEEARRTYRETFGGEEMPSTSRVVFFGVDRLVGDENARELIGMAVKLVNRYRQIYGPDVPPDDLSAMILAFWR